MTDSIQPNVQLLQWWHSYHFIIYRPTHFISNFKSIWYFIYEGIIIPNCYICTCIMSHCGIFCLPCHPNLLYTCSIQWDIWFTWDPSLMSIRFEVYNIYLICQTKNFCWILSLTHKNIWATIIYIYIWKLF